MKLLTAAVPPDSDDELEFCFAVAGEIVFPAVDCGAQEYDPRARCRCGCGVAFVGLASRAATTCAQVREVDVTREQLVDLLLDFVVPLADDEAVLLDPEVRDDAEWLARALTEAASAFPVGARVRREQKVISTR